MGADAGPQGVHAEWNPVLDQGQINPRATVGDEPPGAHPLGGTIGPDPAPADQVLRLAPGAFVAGALTSGAGELDPQVPRRLGVVSPGEHPGAQHRGLLAGRVDATGVGVQQERQQHVHGGGLARAVDPSQQQPPASEVQGLVAVLVHVDDAGAMQHPTVGHDPQARETPAPAAEPGLRGGSPTMYKGAQYKGAHDPRTARRTGRRTTGPTRRAGR